MIRRICFSALLLALAAAFCAGSFAGESIDTYIKQLKDKDPAVRANAAYELSCG